MEEKVDFVKERKTYLFKEQMDVYQKNLEDEYNDLNNEVINYRLKHKTNIIKDKELLNRIQDNAIKRNFGALSKCLEWDFDITEKTKED